MRPKNCQGCKLILPDTKGGKEIEVAFIPQKIADRLKEYNLIAHKAFLDVALVISQ